MSELKREVAALKLSMSKLMNGGMDNFTEFGYVQFDGVNMRLDSEGQEFIAIDSGDALASIPNGASIVWSRDKYDGTKAGEIGGGYSTPSTYTFHNMVMRAFANADGANAKIGVWDESTGDWSMGLSVQDSPAVGDLVTIFKTSTGQTVTTSYAIFTFSGTTDGYLSLLRGGSQKQVLVVGDVATLAINNQTSGVTAAVNDYVRCSGTFTVTLPSAPANNSIIVVKNNGTGVITVARGGSDTIFTAVAAQTSYTLAPGESTNLIYYTTGTEWSVW